MMENRVNRQTERREPLTAIAETIVRGRFVIFALFLVAAVFCALTVGRVRINSSLTAFLPKDTETRRGIDAMEKEFTTYGVARILIEGVPYAEAEETAQKIGKIEHVYEVAFDDTAEHYKDGNALLAVSFDEPETGEGAGEAMGRIRELLGELPYRFSVSGDVGYNYQSELEKEMVVVLSLAAAVIVLVLLFTSRSYFEIVVYFVVFGVSALLNMGTNWWLGEISAITNTVAVILQLALAIDYAIIFSHRYQDEAEKNPDSRAAIVPALAHSIVEISSSSLTTVSGLVALMLMRFRLGYDLGIVLAKGVVCSMLTVFLLMPGLILLFPRALRKTRHRSFVPNIARFGRLLQKKVPVFLILFAVILPFSFILSQKTEYSFAKWSITEVIPSDYRSEHKRVEETFPAGTAVALLVPAGDYDKERAVLEEVAQVDGVTSAAGLAVVEIGEGRMLTDRYTAGEFSALLGIGEEDAERLYRFYALEYGNAEAFKSPGTYPAPLIDVLVTLFRVIDQKLVTTLTPEQTEQLAVYRTPIERAAKQLKGRTWDRLVLTTSLPVEGKASVELVETVRAVAEREYGEGTVLAVGDITSARDLEDFHRSDSILIGVLSVVFVFLILLFTFRSPVVAAALVFVIEGSIRINFSFPYLTGDRAAFVTNMIVSAIQMGATIDYAIVTYSRYRERRKTDPPREAMIKAQNDAFPTVLTSGTIMAAAGLLIAYRVSDVYVGHIGLAVGRGALISMILVLTVLPQLLPPLDRAIMKTTFRFPCKNGENKDRPLEETEPNEGEEDA